MWSLNQAASQILVLSIFTIISNKFTSPLVDFEDVLNRLLNYCFKRVVTDWIGISNCFVPVSWADQEIKKKRKRKEKRKQRSFLRFWRHLRRSKLMWSLEINITTSSWPSSLFIVYLCTVHPCTKYLGMSSLAQAGRQAHSRCSNARQLIALLSIFTMIHQH